MSLTSQALINGATKQAFTSSWQNVQSSNLWINLGAWSQNKGVGLSAQTYPQETLTGSAPTQTMATGTLQNGSTSGFITVRNTGAADYMFTRLSFLAEYIPYYFSGGTQFNFMVYDLLFTAGVPLTTVTNITVTTPPSWSSRVPVDNLSNPDYKGLELWLMLNQVTNTFTLTVTYTNQDGTASQVTPAVTPIGPTGGGATTGAQAMMMRIPLAVGDCGLQTISGISITSASSTTSSTANIMVMRKLAAAAPTVGNKQTSELDLLTMGANKFSASAALVFMSLATAGGSTQTDMIAEIASG